MKKIAFILPNLLTGGSQRAMVNIMESLDKVEFELVLIVIHSFDKNYRELKTGSALVSNYDPNRIRTINLGCSGVKWSALKIRKVLQKEKPDVLFSSISYLNLYLGIFKFLLPAKTILAARETNVLSVKHAAKKAARLLNFVYRLAYRNIDSVVCQSQDMEHDLIENFSVDFGKCQVIHNPINCADIYKKSEIPLENDFIDKSIFNIVSVGHLTFQKGHETLIRALAKIDDLPLIVHLVGRGPLRAYLADLAIKLGVEQKIIFHGFQENPFNFLANCDAFVFPSRFEGFPNALIEAGCLGLPLIANNCKGGVNEIVHDGNGVIFEKDSTDDLASKIRNVLTSQFEPQFIRSDIKKRFDLASIGKKYDAYFRRILEN